MLTIAFREIRPEGLPGAAMTKHVTLSTSRADVQADSGIQESIPRDVLVRLMGRCTCERAFTLIELVIAVAILALALLAMMKMQTSALQGTAFGGRMTTALVLAQHKMEELINEPWPTSGANPVCQWSDNTDSDFRSVFGNLSGYRLYWCIYMDHVGGQVEGVYVPNVATLSVWVSWPGGNIPFNLVSLKRR